MTRPAVDSPFLTSATGKAWRRLGAVRRAGVCAPLFSLRSRNSVGVGEFTDIPLLADWCRATGQSIIQLLPLNDVGFDFAPYSAQSSLALEPMYLSLGRILGAPFDDFAKDIDALAHRFPLAPRMDQTVKGAKLEILWRMCAASTPDKNPAFRKFRDHNRAWLRDYALFKALKDKFAQSTWESWQPPFRDRDPAALAAFEKENAGTILFHQWLQWQCAEQLAAARAACNARGVFLMGDIPFLTSRDSADVWTFRDFFKLHLESGAPPDMFSQKGQRWGMPPYNWDRVAAANWDFLKIKLGTAAHFYDLYRIDHVIGVFRVFTVPTVEPLENGALNGVFDPPDRNLWEAHGRKVLAAMVAAAPGMLPCGEDLGDVPLCNDAVLKEMGIPGLNVQRWTRDWRGDKSFIPPERYRTNACAVLSTHDTSLCAEWWTREADAEEKAFFLKFLDGGAAEMSPLQAVRRCLEKAAESAAVFSIQLVQDLWSAGNLLPGDPAAWRVNRPGWVGPENWSVVLPKRLEEWIDLPMNDYLADLHRKTGRV